MQELDYDKPFTKIKSKLPPHGGLILAIIISVGIVFSLGVYVGSKNGSKIDVSMNAPFGVADAEKADFASFWKVWTALQDRYVGSTTPTTKEKIWGATAGLTASYKDPYTVFFPPEESKEFSDQVSGNFEGVGMEVGLKDGGLVVIAPLEGTPASKAGIQAGDRIYKIDEKVADGLSVDAAVKLIRGKKDTTVKLLIGRKGKTTPFDISIVRGIIDIPTTKTEIKDGVFIIHLYNFSAVSMAKFREALKAFLDSGSDKLVLDLRNNPGGYLEAAVDMASFFLPAGDVVVSEDYGTKKEAVYHRSKGYNIFNDKLKMVILLNGGSASASEILAGALHDQKGYRLIGEKSFGKGSVQEVVDAGDGTSLKVTIARWLTPKKVSISHNGLDPDVAVPMTYDQFTKDGDIQLKAAVDLLKKEGATSSTSWILNTPQVFMRAVN